MGARTRWVPDYASGRTDGTYRTYETNVFIADNSCVRRHTLLAPRF